MAEGRAYTPLLDADIGAIIRRAHAANPDVRIHASEDTERLHPLLRDWFGLLDQHVLGRYDTRVVFRDRPTREALM